MQLKQGLQIPGSFLSLPGAGMTDVPSTSTFPQGHQRTKLILCSKHFMNEPSPQPLQVMVLGVCH